MGEKHFKKSKFLSYLLRHHPEYANLHMEINGFVPVRELVENSGFTEDMLKEIVETDNKQRYSFNEDGTKIRANQGHSIPWVEVDLRKVDIDEIEQNGNVLYHGTGRKSLESILEQGLKKMERNHVHLSKTIDIAKVVGARHGECVVLVVDAKQMILDGNEIFISSNGVYLTDFVDKKYIKVLEE